MDIFITFIISLNTPLAPKLWAEAVNTACFIRNRLFSRSVIAEGTPYAVIYGKKQDFSRLEEFGFKSFVHVPNKVRNWKFSERAKVGTFLEYGRGNVYRVLLDE